MTRRNGKFAIFIAGANLYATVKTLAFELDFKRLLNAFPDYGRLVRAFYYTAVFEDQEYQVTRPLIDWLDERQPGIRPKLESAGPPAQLSTAASPQK